MKRLLCTLAICCISLASLFAEIYPSKRFVEMGLDFGVAAGQNAFGLKDVLVKDLVIDLNKLYEGMGGSDFKLNLGFNQGYHFDINVGGFGAGIKENLEFHTNLSIDNALFRLLAEGNELNESETIGTSLSFESFISTSTPVRFKIGKIGIMVEPTYFVPIAYMPSPRIEATYTTNADGTITLDANANFDLYTAFDISPLLAEEKGEIDLTKLPEELKNGGFDLSARVEYPLFDFLDIGGYANIPIYPGKLHYHTYGTATFGFVMDDFLGWATSDPDTRPEEPYTINEPDWSGVMFDEEGFNVNRPLRLGVEAAWRPVGNWFVVHPKLGVAARNPFGKDFGIHNLFPEYSISADMTFLYVFGFNLSTAYENQTFTHSAGLSLNARILELDFSVGTSNSDFRKSFSLGGAQATLGVKMGF